jgi:hypothetical protein
MDNMNPAPSAGKVIRAPSLKRGKNEETRIGDRVSSLFLWHCGARRHMWGWDLVLTERRNNSNSNNNNNDSTASKGFDEPWVGIMKNE